MLGTIILYYIIIFGDPRCNPERFKQLTKTGMLFVLDALSGIPVFPVEERSVPPSRLPDEQAWPTQTFAMGDLGNLIPQNFTEEDIFDWEINPAHYEDCLNKIHNISWWGIRNGTGQIFTPTDLVHGTIHIPGDLGGGNWMSLAVHPEKQMAVLPVNHLPRVRTLFHISGPTDAGYCSTSRFMINSSYTSCASELHASDQVPCYKPPWARIIAVDLQEGKLNWMKPFASPYGSPQFFKKEYGARRVIGGLIITASGLIFGTGGEDMKLWVYNLDNGDILWESEELDYDPSSVPMTYSVDGRQFVILNAGGHWSSIFGRGDMIYAFALPPEMIAIQSTTESSSTTKPPASRANVPMLSFISLIIILLLQII